MSQIDVNIAAKHGACSTEHHDSPECEPINIPCRLPPSVTFEVPLGECNGDECYVDARENFRYTHGPRCPARPIRISCSISGKTWEESKVTNVDIATTSRFLGWDDEGRCIDACRDRWPIVKALVLGMPRSEALDADAGDKVLALFTQRDAVYAALADMARAEEAASAAQDRAHAALGDDLRLKPHHNIDVADRPSAYMLERYVERLTEQVGHL